jgi:hypothetical protein
MTPEEARDQALRIMGLDEFQRIAVVDLSRDIDLSAGMPAPGSEEERRLIELGRFVLADREETR